MARSIITPPESGKKLLGRCKETQCVVSWVALRRTMRNRYPVVSRSTPEGPHRGYDEI
jgi:hypothetical protein